MDFEYQQLFDNKISTFLDVEAPEIDDNEDEHSEGMKTYNCTHPGCKKNFRYRSEILRHMVTHTNKRPYVCTFKNCMKGFKRSDALATHMRIHTREKTFECLYAACKSTFSTKAGLKYHTLKHKTDKRAMNKNTQELKVFSMVDQENLKYETNDHDFSQNVGVEFCEEPMLETPYENLNFIKHYSHTSNYSFNGFDCQFDNTQVQQIVPISFGDNAVSSERNESDTYLTNYSTPSNPSGNSGEVDGYLNYHFTNVPQNVANCAANLINYTEEASSNIKAKSLMNKSETSDRIVDMMQKIIEENSNLKKKLDLYQRLMRGPQYLGDEQRSFF